MSAMTVNYGTSGMTLNYTMLCDECKTMDVLYDVKRQT